MSAIIISCTLIICLFGGYAESPNPPSRGLDN